MTLLVSDVMTRGLRAVPPDMTLLALERFFLETKIGGAPVVRAGELVGVVSRTDVLRRLLSAVDLRECAEFEHRRAVSGLDVPLRDLWPTAERTLSPRVEAQLQSLTVADIMSERPVTIAAQAPLASAGRLMLAERIHRVIVLENGKPTGIVSTFDIVRCFCGSVP